MLTPADAPFCRQPFSLIHHQAIIAGLSYNHFNPVQVLLLKIRVIRAHHICAVSPEIGRLTAPEVNHGLIRVIPEIGIKHAACSEMANNLYIVSVTGADQNLHIADIQVYGRRIKPGDTIIRACKKIPVVFRKYDIYSDICIAGSNLIGFIHCQHFRYIIPHV